MIVVFLAHAIVVPQQVADSSPSCARTGSECAELVGSRRLQDQALLVLPRIVWLTRQSKPPLGRIAVRECALRRHDKAVVEQALDAVGLLALAVELDPAD